MRYSFSLSVAVAFSSTGARCSAESSAEEVVGQEDLNSFPGFLVMKLSPWNTRGGLFGRAVTGNQKSFLCTDCCPLFDPSSLGRLLRIQQ